MCLRRRSDRFRNEQIAWSTCDMQHLHHLEVPNQSILRPHSLPHYPWQRRRVGRRTRHSFLMLMHGQTNKLTTSLSARGQLAAMKNCGWDLLSPPRRLASCVGYLGDLDGDRALGWELNAYELIHSYLGNDYFTRWRQTAWSYQCRPERCNIFFEILLIIWKPFRFVPYLWDALPQLYNSNLHIRDCFHSKSNMERLYLPLLFEKPLDQAKQ